MFTQLLNDVYSENKYCVDCGWKMGGSKGNSTSMTELFDQIYVSVNHGIFMCYNCARIHQTHYGVQISFVKSIIDNTKLPTCQEYFPTDPGTENDHHQFPVKLSKWTYTQLRVLLISGGNKAFRDYMDQYDLMHDTI